MQTPGQAGRFAFWAQDGRSLMEYRVAARHISSAAKRHDKCRASETSWMAMQGAEVTEIAAPTFRSAGSISRASPTDDIGFLRDSKAAVIPISMPPEQPQKRTLWNGNVLAPYSVARRRLIDVCTLMNMLMVRVVGVQIARFGWPMMEATFSPHEPHKRLIRLRQVAVEKVTTEIAERATDLRAILADFAIQGRKA